MNIRFIPIHNTPFTKCSECFCVLLEIDKLDHAAWHRRGNRDSQRI
jgi:hypothetical protein